MRAKLGRRKEKFIGAAQAAHAASWSTVQMISKFITAGNKNDAFVRWLQHPHTLQTQIRAHTHTYHFIRRHCDRSIERKVSGRRNGMDVTKNINQIKRDSRSRRKRRGKNGKKITSCLLLYAPNPQRPRSCRHRRRRKSYHCQSHSFSFYFSNINFYMKSSKL